MYSYEDKIRAVELYIKLGKSVRSTIRQLGYPTKNALKGWYRISSGMTFRPATHAVNRSSRRSRRLQRSSTTSPIIDASLPASGLCATRAGEP